MEKCSYGLEPQTPDHILKHCPAHDALMPDMTTGGRAEVEAMGLALRVRPGEDSGLCLGKEDSDLDSMTKHLNAEEQDTGEVANTRKRNLTSTD